MHTQSTPEPRLARSEWPAGLLFWGLLAVAWLALSQGQTALFMFDDHVNLVGLDELNQNPSFSAFSHFILNGFSSQLGRPLTLATFAAQFYSWPSAPGDFIRVNVLLHLVNGCLLFWVLLRLTRLAGVDAKTATLVSMAATAWWLLAPLQASAVLYIIQRLAVLSAVFMLGGMLVYLAGRARLLQDRAPSGYLLMTAGLGLGLVGVLAKENAALLPLSLLVVEYTLLAGLPRDRLFRLWSALCLWLPTVALVAFLLLKIPAFLDAYEMRQFTLGERLLTQPRVLFVYLYKLVIPSISSIRLLYDDLPVSRGLLDPWTTAASIAGWLLLAGLALRYRRQQAAFSFAVLWFLANHLLESTLVPLEIAFEHRNYVASIGPVLGLVLLAGALHRSPPVERMRPLLAAGAGAYLVFLYAALWASASLWGDAFGLREYWGRTQPLSRRAQIQWADINYRRLDPAPANAILDRAMANFPGDPTFPMTLLEYSCLVSDMPVPPWERFAGAAQRFDGEAITVMNLITRLISAKEEYLCSRLSTDDIRALMGLFEPLPEFRRYSWIFSVYRSRLARVDEDFDATFEHLDVALAEKKAVQLLRLGVTFALHKGDPQRARHYLRLTQEAREAQPLQRPYLDEVIAEMQTAIAQLEAGTAPSYNPPP